MTGICASAWFGTAAISQAQETGDLPRTERLRPPRSLTVHGEAEVSAAPDQALVQVGAEATATEAVAAQQKINAIMDKALQRIRNLKIPDNAIQTSGLSLAPIYAQNSLEPQTVTGYRAADVLLIRVDDLSLLGKVIDTAIGAGANRLQGVSFQLKQDLPERAHALQIAIRDANAKAEAMAEALGVRLGPVRSISEEGAMVVPRPQFMAAERALSRATPVQPGEVRVQANVTVIYDLGERGNESRNRPQAEAAPTRRQSPQPEASPRR